MAEAVIRELFTYPVKGCQAVPVPELQVSKLGIPGDRDFAIWEDGALVDAKDTPRVASVGASFDAATGTLTLTNANGDTFAHPARSEGAPRQAQWVLDQFTTVDQGDEVAAFLTEAIGKPVRLVAAGDSWKINFPIPQMALLHDEEKRSFFAASPVSLANLASLEDLNRKLEAPAPMNRFRMNVIVDGLAPYQEDDLVSLATDEVELLQVTPAERCVIVETDQQAGERSKTGLLKHMKQKSKEERFGSGRIFGSYLQVAKAGTLRVGDRLRVR